MVGCFLPLITALEKRQIKVVSVDDVPKPCTKPPEEVEKLLPESQIAIITATAIINKTIDNLLELADSCREVAVLGPSTPLLTEAFSQTTVSCLSGIRILEPEKVLQIIGEGGGFYIESIFFKTHFNFQYKGISVFQKKDRKNP